MVSDTKPSDPSDRTTESVNPYASPVDSPRSDIYADLGIGERYSRRAKSAIGIAALMIIGSAVAAGFAVWDIETIIASGPCLLIAALILFVLATGPRLDRLRYISYAAMVAVVSCFLTIYFNDWSPREAQSPIGGATVVIATLMQLGWISVVRSRSDPDEQSAVT